MFPPPGAFVPPSFPARRPVFLTASSMENKTLCELPWPFLRVSRPWLKAAAVPVGSAQFFDQGVAVPGLTPVTVACRLPTPTLHVKHSTIGFSIIVDVIVLRSEVWAAENCSAQLRSPSLSQASQGYVFTLESIGVACA